MTQERPLVLVVDDDQQHRDILLDLLALQGYETLAVDNGEKALQTIPEHMPDLVLLDVEMPGMSGFEVVKRLKQGSATASVPVIMITGRSDRRSRLRSLESGAEDYLTKPFDPIELQARIRNHIRLKQYRDMLSDFNRSLEQRVRERTRQLQDACRETIHLLTSAAEYRDENTGSHVRRISHFTAALARAMKMDDDFVDNIFYASPMHDIGKIGIPDSILVKEGPLSQEEWAVMKTHTTLGKRILERGVFPYVRMGAVIAETHHECWDGSGYPAGLKGEQIPLESRIMLLCDQYDALRSPRPYKPAFDHEHVIKILREGDGRTTPDQFCPAVIEVFEGCTDEFDLIYSRNF